MSTLASVYGGNLGDTLWLTPLAQYIPNLIVLMRKGDAKAESVAPILDGVCKVILDSSPPETQKVPLRAHVTQQILAAYGHAGKPSIPRVVLKPSEIQWAIDFLQPYGPKTVAMVNHCSGAGDPTNYRAHYVKGNAGCFDVYQRFWRGAGYRVLQFGPAPGFYTKDVFSPIEGAIPIRGLSVRQLAAVYHVIGKLVSVDTGDYHLMLAVGGKAACLVPPDSPQMGYNHWDLHYNDICWGGERPRVGYTLHSNWTRYLNTALFDNIDSFTV